MIKFALKYIPRPWLIRLSYVVQFFAPVLYGGSRFVDPIDGKGYRKFLPYGYGGNIRENALSPGTNSLERHRLMWLYLKRESDFFTQPKKVLHVAPEQCFYGRFRKMSNLDYTTADLDSPIADISMDIHDIPFEENTFDVVFCNHVLEHVDDDQQCMRELCRVLKPGGMAIMQVPYIPNQEVTVEDPSITDPAERERLFGQYDHVRKYGKDYADRLKNAGFKVTKVDFSEILPSEEFDKYRLPKGEPLYVCSK
ncbi:MAG: SAM-dependent methyltransferase [Bacteroidetes bacterium]|uniref:Methyltransferase domain-containing protein n=1 Tax=Phaeocystidibacter marisrubri TaxID=1577780 RepID=A0A6L3ZE59_9FLAO|nr:class I SAM-dependent methyltransferase [Phaeocystidibacter marisrubri]KAB2815737.1 methyltransferase domain-containing protein [Phaeocystidibacter marisrubri]TNE30553.1 MAG: SAM-dependent methyltransferase [Bacteroidota bacterium]GGH65455.1 SAM-dependent methyltransferase [Phaeocystidibacter marisrubri]